MCNWKGFCGHLTDVPSKYSLCFDSLSGIFVLGNNIKNINMHTILLFYILVFFIYYVLQFLMARVTVIPHKY